MVLSAELGAVLDVGKETVGVPAARGFRVQQQQQQRQRVTEDCG